MLAQMSHEELFIAFTTTLVVAIIAPMIVAWWTTRLRLHEALVVKAREEVRDELKAVIDAEIKDKLDNIADSTNGSLIEVKDQVRHLTELLEMHDIPIPPLPKEYK